MVCIFNGPVRQHPNQDHPKVGILLHPDDAEEPHGDTHHWPAQNLPHLSASKGGTF
jgi:hypothetical protein